MLALIVVAAAASVATAAMKGRAYLSVCREFATTWNLGGAGILVYDLDGGHKSSRRIATTASWRRKTDNK